MVSKIPRINKSIEGDFAKRLLAESAAKAAKSFQLTLTLAVFGENPSAAL